MQSLAFEDVKNCLLERILYLLQNEQLSQAEETACNQQPNGQSGSTLVHQAIMKAVCYS